MDPIIKKLCNIFQDRNRLKKTDVILLICVAAGTVHAQSPQIVYITPSFNEISTSDNPEITVTFNISINISSFDNLSFSVLGERSGYHSGKINFSNDNKTVSFISSRQYNSGERVRVTLSNKIRSMNGDPLNGFTWEFHIASKQTYVHFDKPVSYGYGSGGLEMQCIDINNDGYPDIITSSGVILINDGTGNFPVYWTLPDADGFYPIEVDDFNRDGFMDVVYRGSDGLKIGMGDGKGNFTIITKPFWFDYFATADLNYDGYPDIVGIRDYYDNNNDLPRLSISFNDNNGNFQDTVSYIITGGGNLRKLILTDIDNDGDIDAVISSVFAFKDGEPYGLDGIVICRNNGKGIFDMFELYPSGTYLFISGTEFLHASDFNNDGYVDFAVMATFAGIVALNHESGIFSDDTTYTRRFWGAENIATITSGDIDGNGWIDLVLSGYRSKPVGEYPYNILYTIFRNVNSYFPNPFGNIDTLFTDTLPRSTYSVATADLNEDGYLDIIHSGLGVFVTLHKDTVTSVNDSNSISNDFTLYQNYPNPFNNQTQITFQLNKPGKVQLYVFNIIGEQVRILENRFFAQGIHKINWDGKDNNKRELPSGVYFIELNTSSCKRVIKALLLR